MRESCQHTARLLPVRESRCAKLLLSPDAPTGTSGSVRHAMAEAADIDRARDHLSRSEHDYRSGDGLRHLEEGLAVLETVALDGSDEQKAIANNLLATYAARLCDLVRRRVEARPALPEPELQHLFRLLLAFDAVELELPGYVRPLKIDIARRLIDRYYEGYPAEEKEKALAELAGLAGE